MTVKDGPTLVDFRWDFPVGRLPTRANVEAWVDRFLLVGRATRKIYLVVEVFLEASEVVLGIGCGEARNWAEFEAQPK